MNPHPEGGYYTETYRSPIEIPGKNRQLMTSIYFLLEAGQVSHLHRIKSDELWFFHSGSPLTVHVIDEEGKYLAHSLGNDLESGQVPQLLVPAHAIFGSSMDLKEGYSLVSCVVAPGFDFEDFELFTAEDLLPEYPEHEAIIKRLT